MQASSHALKSTPAPVVPAEKLWASARCPEIGLGLFKYSDVAHNLPPSIVHNLGSITRTGARHIGMQSGHEKDPSGAGHLVFLHFELFVGDTQIPGD